MWAPVFGKANAPKTTWKGRSSPVGLPLQASSSPLRLGLAPAGPSGGRFFVYDCGNACNLAYVRGLGRGRPTRGATLLTIYRDSGEARSSHAGGLPDEVIWLDLLNPTDEEKAFVESRTGLRVPSLEALSEIESSSRLVVDHGVIYLSMPLVAQGDTEDYHGSPAGFVLSPSVLITVRFADISTFKLVADKVRADEMLRSSAGVFTALMEALVDRGADVLERLAGDLDRISRSVFRGKANKVRHSARATEALRQALTAVGTIGDRLSQARDVFLGVDRMVPFVVGLKPEWIIPEFE